MAAIEEHSVTFRSGALALEGRLAVPETVEPVRAAVVCHPHPLYGGSMHNNVVEAILAAAWSLGYATLRFNFRGVGRSEGEHGGGEAELADVRAAVGFIAAQPGVKRDGIVLAGYSFGARVSMRIAPQLKEVVTVVAVALPVSTQMGPPPAGGWNKPLILIAGDRDSFCSVPDLEAFQARVKEQSKLQLIGGSDHFFAGFEPELARAITAALGPA